MSVQVNSQTLLEVLSLLARQEQLLQKTLHLVASSMLAFREVTLCGCCGFLCACRSSIGSIVAVRLP